MDFFLPKRLPGQHQQRWKYGSDSRDRHRLWKRERQYRRRGNGQRWIHIDGPATFNCPLVLPNPPTTPGSCYPGSETPSLLATLTVYNEGLNNTNWLVTAPSATGTPNVINCGPAAGTSASVCVATYPVGTAVTLTAPATGAAFGGWSSNCTNIGTITAAGPNSCTVTLTTNDTVGAIFN